MEPDGLSSDKCPPPRRRTACRRTTWTPTPTTGRATTNRKPRRTEPPDALRDLRQRAGAAWRPRRRQRGGVQGLRGVQRAGRGARLPELVRGRASLHRLRPDLGDAESPDVGRRAHLDAAPGHRGDGAPVAQPGAAGRAGRDHGPAVQRARRPRHRPGLPSQRVRRILRPDGRSRGALRRVGPVVDPGLDVRRAVVPPGQVLAVRERRGRAADGAEAASPPLDGRRTSGVDQEGGGPRL